MVSRFDAPASLCPPHSSETFASYLTGPPFPLNEFKKIKRLLHVELIDNPGDRFTVNPKSQTTPPEFKEPCFHVPGSRTIIDTAELDSDGVFRSKIKNKPLRRFVSDIPKQKSASGKTFIAPLRIPARQNRRRSPKLNTSTPSRYCHLSAGRTPKASSLSKCPSVSMETLQRSTPGSESAISPSTI